MRFTDPVWTAVGVGIVGSLAAGFSALAVGTMTGDALGVATRLALAEGGVLALVRLALWQWADRSGSVTALRSDAIPESTCPSRTCAQPRLPQDFSGDA